MKTLRLVSLTILLATATLSTAQVSVNVNINAPAPAWIAAPQPAARFYYLPDIQVYYDRPAAQFIYYGGGGWVRTRQLPAHYGNYDYYRGRTVCLTDYRGNVPYHHFNSHKVRYGRSYHAPGRAYVKHGRGHGHHFKKEHHGYHKKHNRHHRD